MSGPYFDWDGGAAYLGTSSRTLRRRLPAIPHFKTDFGIRFAKEDLDEYMKHYRREPTRPAKVNLDAILGPRKKGAK